VSGRSRPGGLRVSPGRGPRPDRLPDPAKPDVAVKTHDLGNPGRGGDTRQPETAAARSHYFPLFLLAHPLRTF